MKDLKTIAQEINDRAANYRMGQFQEIRRNIQGRSRVQSHDLFTFQTIKESWAFHSGGRKELQFNIGFEGDDSEWFRYGVAFSLERSHTLPDPLVLKPKILKLNQYFSQNPTEYEDLRFWYWSDVRSVTFPLGPVPDDLIRVGYFLFWGKLTPSQDIEADEILFLFDRLLNLYEYVEGNATFAPKHVDLREGFNFKPGCSSKADTAIGHSKAAAKSILLRHNTLQVALHKALCSEFGKANVGTENDTGRGSRIDLVVKSGREFIYYEIKTHPCIRTCLREALAQLLEYSYWPGGNIAKHMVVVPENPLTKDAKRYLNLLRDEFQLPIFYQRFDLNSLSLSKRE